MAKRKHYKAMTVRLDPKIFEQIEIRAAVNRRSKTLEIEYLLSRALDRTVRDDFESILGQASGQTQS